MIRQSHGSARTELPRSSDLPVPSEHARQTQPRGTDGRFLSGPRGGDYRAPRSLERRMLAALGCDLPGEAGELARAAWATYRAFCDELPALSAGVRSLVMQRARAATLAARYARRGAEVGLDTPEGAAALQESARWCQRAERLAVSSMDISTRLAHAASRGRILDAHAEVAAAFGGDP